MIGRLQGTLIEKQPPQLLIDVNGVGYEVEASMNTIYQCPDLGQPLTLLTQLIVREDAQLLYGFFEAKERTLFRALIKVNGVGPKLAIAILSSIKVDEFIFSVNQQDTASLVKIPGVGKKTAERLVIEMRDRLPGDDLSLPTAQGSGSSTLQDAISALIALGYKPQQASRMVSQINTEGKTSEAVIKEALQSSVLV